MNKTISDVKKIILELSESRGVKKGHIINVVKYSLFLAKKLKADREICEIAAWLHDIDKLKGGKEGHHIRGAKDAEEILTKLKYPKDKIKKVCYCILTHSSDKNYLPKTLEAKIVASADALAHFDDFLEIVYFYYNRGLTIDETRDRILKKADKSFNKMMPYAKKLAKKRYDAIKILLK